MLPDKDKLSVSLIAGLICIERWSYGK